MRVTNPAPPVVPGRSMWTVDYMGEELVVRSMVDFSLDSCVHATSIASEWRKEDNSFRMRQMPLKLNCRMALAEFWV